MQQEVEFQIALKLAALTRSAVRSWIWRDQLHLSAEFDLKTLQGACGLASYTLWLLLKRMNIYSTLVMCVEDDGYAHCWIELYDRVIDITAMQFPNIDDEIYVSDLTRTAYYMSVVGESAEPMYEYVDESAIADFRKSWGRQNPFCFEDDINEFIKECCQVTHVTNAQDLQYDSYINCG